MTDAEIKSLMDTLAKELLAVKRASLAATDKIRAEMRMVRSKCPHTNVTVYNETYERYRVCDACGEEW